LSDYLYDFLAIGAHADDVELMAGGTIARLVAKGRKGVIADMATAEMGSRGDASVRAKEARRAAEILGVNERINLGLPDAQLYPDKNSVDIVVGAIRKYRPRIIITHYHDDLHPDHYATCEIVKNAWYKAGLAKYGADRGEPWRPERIVHAMGPVDAVPVFCVDISEYFSVKMKAVLAYESQFHNENAHRYEGKSSISTPAFLEFIETRNKYFGGKIKRGCAEPFWSREYAEVDDITNLGDKIY
jgi:N-acetylglucosamine malate deacetylase 1